MDSELEGRSNFFTYVRLCWIAKSKRLSVAIAKLCLNQDADAEWTVRFASPMSLLIRSLLHIIIEAPNTLAMKAALNRRLFKSKAWGSCAVDFMAIITLWVLWW
jgi:hypothetical protein